MAQAVGLAAGRVDIMMPLLKDWDFDALITHNRFTLVNRNAGEMMDYARERRQRRPSMPRPIAGGVLAKVHGIAQALCLSGGLTPKRWRRSRPGLSRSPPATAFRPAPRLLQFSLRDERVSSTICGISKPERIKQTLEARYPVPQAVWDELMALPFERGDPEATRVYRPG